MSGTDPQTDSVSQLFNPRWDRWSEHFTLVGVEIIGLTKVGRATVRLLRMNDPERVEVRRDLAQRGEFDVPS